MLRNIRNNRFIQDLVTIDNFHPNLTENTNIFYHYADPVARLSLMSIIISVCWRNQSLNSSYS